MSSQDDGATLARPKRRRGIAFYGLSTILLLIALALLILELIPANEYLFLPGDALPVASMIAVKGYPIPKGSGRLLMTDVSLQKVDHLLEELYGRLNPDAELAPAQAVSGNLTPTQYQRENVRAMNSSVQNAEAAAFHVAFGYSVRCSSKGPVIVETQPDTPAAHSLRAGDVVESIDGYRIHCAREVGPLIKRQKIGAAIELTVLRQGRLRTLRIRTIAAPGTSGTQREVPIIGVFVEDQLHFPPFPVKVSIRVGDISGPSAGLMFSLGIVERLQHRDLTKGCTVAGTGTIDPEGIVGPIGGAKQKAIAARRAGAKYFLVPDEPDNVGPALSARGKVTVVPVKTLQQALTYLEHIKPCT